MRGVKGSGVAANRAATTGGENDELFKDYIKFDDLFGASSLFTDGTARQRKLRTEVYVKDTMERRLYGYVHRLHNHGDPIQQVAVGAGCEDDPGEGFSFGAQREAAHNGACRRPKVDEGRACHVDMQGANGRPRKKARRCAIAPAFGAHQRTPGPWIGRGRPSDASMRMAPNGCGIQASLFEREDWEADPLWAAMEEACAQGGAWSALELDDPSTLLGPGGNLGGSAPLRSNALETFDGDILHRVRFDEIEVRRATPRRCSSTRAISPRHPPLERNPIFVVRSTPWHQPRASCVSVPDGPLAPTAEGSASSIVVHSSAADVVCHPRNRVVSPLARQERVRNLEYSLALAHRTPAGPHVASANHLPDARGTSSNPRSAPLQENERARQASPKMGAQHPHRLFVNTSRPRGAGSGEHTPSSGATTPHTPCPSTQAQRRGVLGFSAFLKHVSRSHLGQASKLYLGRLECCASAASSSGGFPRRARDELQLTRHSSPLPRLVSTGGVTPKSPEPKAGSLPNPSRSLSGSDGRNGRREGHFDPWATDNTGRRCNSTSFTSTADHDALEGYTPHETCQTRDELLWENASLRDARLSAHREAEFHRSRSDHSREQARLLQESNARYEARLEQLEELVRASTSQAAALRERLAQVTAVDAKHAAARSGAWLGTQGGSNPGGGGADGLTDGRDGRFERGVNGGFFPEKEGSIHEGKAFRGGDAEAGADGAGVPATDTGRRGLDGSPDVSTVDSVEGTNMDGVERVFNPVSYSPERVHPEAVA